MQTQIKNGFVNDVISEINQTGETLKNDFAQLAKSAQKKIDSQVVSANFEAVYGLTTTKKQRKKTMGDVKEVREELWANALKKAKGNTNDAYDLYCKSCSF